MNRKLICLAAASLIVIGCAAQQARQRTPVLYPNETQHSKTQSQIDADIRECDYKADRYVQKPTTGQQISDVMLTTLEDAAVGTAVGAVGGAIMGGKVGRATGAGAAAGGMIGAYGAIKELNKIDPKEREFIKACLEEKGYKVIGWESE